MVSSEIFIILVYTYKGDKMFFIGDIHGNFNYVSYFIKSNKIKNSNIILVGDAGAGFNLVRKPIDQENLNALAGKTHNMIYVCRGNHDNPSVFNGKHDYENIKFVKDYSVLTIEGKQVLFLGGAISIDRKLRSEHVNYWKNEAFYYDENRLKKIRADIIVSHSAPDLFEPIGFGGIPDSFFINDPSLKGELLNERKNLSFAFDILRNNNSDKKMYWVYGHFHNSFKGTYKDVYTTCLNIHEIYQIYDF